MLRRYVDNQSFAAAQPDIFQLRSKHFEVPVPMKFGLL